MERIAHISCSVGYCLKQLFIPLCILYDTWLATKLLRAGKRAVETCFGCTGMSTLLIRTRILQRNLQALGAKLRDNLGASMLPYFTMFICSNLGGIIADFMIERKLSVGTTRKFINTSGFVSTALALLEIPSAKTANGCSVRHAKCIQLYCHSVVTCL